MSNAVHARGAPAPSDPVIDAFQHQIRLAGERGQYAELERVQAEFAYYLESARSADQLLDHVSYDLRLDTCHSLSALESQMVRTLLEYTAERPLRNLREGLSRGCAWFQVREFEKALQSFDRALATFERQESMTRGRLMLQLNRGYCCLELGRYAEAKLAFNKVLLVQPGNGSALRGYGRALVRLGQPTSAIVAFNRALESDPGDADLHYRLGSVLLSVGCSDQAKYFLRLAHEALPEDLAILQQMGRAQAQSGDWGQAAGTLDLALAISRGCDQPSPIQEWITPQAPQVSRTQNSEREVSLYPHRSRSSGYLSLRRLRRPPRSLLVVISMYVGHIVLRALGF